MAGEQDPATVTELVEAIIEAEPLARLDYAAVLDADSLAVPEKLVGNVRLFAAVHFGRARLIDNVGVTV
jgi:pantoate--beta-alanine ligase